MFIKKNVIILHPADKTACAFYRCDAMAFLLRSSRSGEIEVIVSRAEVTDDYILKYTAAVVFFRVKTEEQATMVRHYKKKRNRFGFKIFCDYDDLIFDIGNFKRLPSWNPNVESENLAENARVMQDSLTDIDGVTVTTLWLKNCMEYRFGWKHVIILPNAVPRFCFGQNPREQIDDAIERPRVLFAGSTCHFSEGNRGDFEGPWIEWLRDAVERDRIELHMFQVPDFLDGVSDKVIVHGQTSCVEFPSVVAGISPDFYVAPLVDNFFNRAKSNLKLLEASAVGAVLVGSSFMWSPYEEEFPMAKVMKGDSPERLDEIISGLCKPNAFNAALAWQKKVMDSRGYWLDSHYYMARWLKAYFGDLLNVNL